MKRALLFATIGALPLLAFQCEKAYTGPDIDFGPGEGITYRDAQGRPSGPQDPSDWTTDATWNAQELTYFNFPTFPINGAQQVGSVTAVGAYPNPGPAGKLTWRLRLSPAAPCPCQVYASLRSRRYTEVDTFLATVAAGDSVAFSPKAYNFDQNYRLYYVVSNANSLLYKGHGDLRFTP